MSKTTTPIPHHPNSPKKLIEEGAIENVQLQADNASTAMLSIAVSLKRIADAVTDAEQVSKLADALLMHPINCYGEGIGQAIQGQIVRGMRGIEQS